MQKVSMEECGREVFGITDSSNSFTPFVYIYFGSVFHLGK